MFSANNLTLRGCLFFYYIQLLVFLKFHDLLLNFFKKVMNRKSENIWLFLEKSFSTKTRKTLSLPNKKEG